MSRRKRSRRKITVRYADGTTRVVGPGAFRKTKKGRDRIPRKGYQVYLRSPHWQKLRRRVLDRDHHRCRKCGSPKALQVHHLTYNRLGHEQLKDLITWCTTCHRDHHGLAGESTSRSHPVGVDEAEARRIRLDIERQERERSKRERYMSMQELEDELRYGGSGRLIA